MKNHNCENEVESNMTLAHCRMCGKDMNTKDELEKVIEAFDFKWYHELEERGMKEVRNDMVGFLRQSIRTLTEQVRAERSREIAQYLTNTFKDKSEIGVNHLLLELGKLSDDHLK